MTDRGTDQREKAINETAERVVNAFDAENWMDWRVGQRDNLLYFVVAGLRDAWDAGLAAGREEEREECARDAVKGCPACPSGVSYCHDTIANRVRARRAKP